MSILIKETKTTHWGDGHLVEIFCPNCDCSIIEMQTWPTDCWYCKTKLPRMYQHLFKRKIARWVYHTREKEI